MNKKPLKKKKSSYFGTMINPEHFHKSQIKFYIILIPLLVVMMLPILFIVSHAFKPLDELYQYPPRFFPSRITLDNFIQLVTATQQTGIPFGRYLFNSILVTALVIFLSLFLGSLAAYAFSFLNFKFKKWMFAANQIAIMFVAVAVAVPRYIVMTQFGIINSFFAHIVPLIAMPVGVFLLKQFMDQIPRELYDAAKIDGANKLQRIFYLILPLLKPTVVILTLLNIGRIFYGDMGMIYGIIGNNPMLVSEVSVIDTYVYQSMRTLGFSYSTAIGLFQSVMGLILVTAANKYAKKINDGEGLF